MQELLEKVYLGTSGWSYKDWVGPFYMEREKSLLQAYARVFKTVEIDSTFYRYPSKGMVMGWVKYSPDGFVYTAKLPKLITHEKKLDLSQGVQEDLEKFIELLEPLRLSGKLGCLIIQLPPKFDYKPKELEDFFKVLPTYVRFAVEFRDPAWMREETWSLLAKYKVAYTIVDEPLLPSETHFTSDFAYFRWHGRGTRPWYNYRYSASELEPWVPKIKEAAEKVGTVYGYFNNHYHGYAVENCLQVLEMLGVLTPQQAEAKNKVQEYFKASTAYKPARLEAYVEPAGLSFESLMHAFIDVDRLKRASLIKDAELRIEKETSKHVEATVREYHIVIDFESRTILHDCADWSKMLPNKRFCKHIGKLLLSMERPKATDLLRTIYTQRES
ncbi:DUF72 domain-containing protein, partial [Candidatus Bathyarchaeota archaeon]|nr:DUF72 domain-containing protein [Candidatus Bathyarchaeota archaeon]